MSSHCVYKFVDPLSEKTIYIGVTANPCRRFKDHLKHIKQKKYVRHPFKCAVQSLHEMGYSYEKLLNCFTIIENNLTESLAYEREVEIIKEHGIDTLKNISTGGRGGDRFTHHPCKESIRKSLKSRIPWNKGKTGLQIGNKTSYTSSPRTLYILQNPQGYRFEIIGSDCLKQFCLEWNKKHNVISVKDTNWISHSAFLLATNNPKSFRGSLKGWSVKKIDLRLPHMKSQ